jgi:hypothetical protein
MADMTSGDGPIAVPVNAESDNEEEGGGGGEEEGTHDIRGSDDDEQEDPKDYCKGGYHPITIGSIFNQRYHVIRKLGWGKNNINQFFFAYQIIIFRSFFYCMVMLGS